MLSLSRLAISNRENEQKSDIMSIKWPHLILNKGTELDIGL